MPNKKCYIFIDWDWLGLPIPTPHGPIARLESSHFSPSGGSCKLMMMTDQRWSFFQVSLWKTGLVEIDGLGGHLPTQNFGRNKGLVNPFLTISKDTLIELAHSNYISFHRLWLWTKNEQLRSSVFFLLLAKRLPILNYNLADSWYQSQIDYSNIQTFHKLVRFLDLGKYLSK